MRKKGVILFTAHPEDQAPKSGSGARSSPRLPSGWGGTGGKEFKAEGRRAEGRGPKKIMPTLRRQKKKENQSTEKTMREKETEKVKNDGK